MTCIALWACVVGPAAHALESDRNQPIRIRATQVNANERTGVTVYQGRVEAIQGSMRITADRVVVRRRNGQTEHIHATGRPLTLKQTPDPDSPDFHAEARRLEYNVKQDAIELFDNVVVTQGKDQMKSAYLYYRLDGEMMRARSDGSDDARVQAVLHPEVKDRELP